LPAGRRTDDPTLDSLDVICFGKEPLEQIVREATEWSGRLVDDGGGLRIRPHDSSDWIRTTVLVRQIKDVGIRHRALEIRHQEISLNLAPAALQRVKEALVSGLELAAAQNRILGVRQRARIPRKKFMLAATMRVLKQMPEHLSDDRHYSEISALVENWLSEVAPDKEEIEYDPIEVGEEIARQLSIGVRRQQSNFEDTGKDIVTKFPDYEFEIETGSKAIEDKGEISVADFPTYKSSKFIPRQPYRGWQKSVYEICSFDSQYEAKLAWMLDNDSDLTWWVRNEPKRFWIPTPAGRFFPDFIIGYNETSEPTQRVELLEAKGDIFWESPTSDARLKAQAARTWCIEQKKAGYDIVNFVALSSEIDKANTFAELKTQFSDFVESNS
jgi:hypothetical protein